MSEEIIESVKECLPVIADTVSELANANSNSPMTTSSNASGSAYPDSSCQNVWEDPVKIKVFGFLSAEGKLKAVLIALGAGAISLIIYKRATRSPKSNPQKKEEKPPQPAPKLTTNRDNIGKPTVGFKCLIPHLAYCGENVLLWGESKIGKSRLGIQWSIDLVQGHHSSLFPSEASATPKHYVFYYAYELDEQTIRERYGDHLNQYENLQVIYAESGIGNPNAILEDLKKRLRCVPQDAYVAVFFDTFAKAVGWGHTYDEKKAGDFLHDLMKLQAESKSLQNITISNIIIAHQKNDKNELEAPNCIRQTVKTEMTFVMKEKNRKYLLVHLRANNMKTLEEPLRLHVEEAPFVQFVADEEENCEDVDTTEPPFKENGDYDWERLRPLIKKLVDDGNSQTEIAKQITNTFGKETNQQSVSAALKRLGIKE